MSHDHNDRISAIFLKACEIEDTEAREAYLAEACGTDAELRAEVDRLLLHDEIESSFLESPALGAGFRLGSPDSLEEASPPLPGEPRTAADRDLVGAAIGRYKIRSILGEGGCGVVYLADQTAPVKRTVALKIIKPGMDSKQVIARFEAERQALAMMDHAHVANVFDAGTTAPELGSLPYFVMEYVEGESITKYCNDHRLSVDERLQLFMQTCGAIQHAHQKGVIHRDMKPSNILVNENEGRPLVKVIDFGVAKAISDKLTVQTIFTEQGQMVGTPEYMSPEQWERGEIDIDTRSDIYSLGVVLYELLTGLKPFDLQTLQAAGLGEMQRVICESEPVKPSTRVNLVLAHPTGAAEVTGSGQDITVAHAPSLSIGDVARSHEMDPRSLARKLRGDLDWITMKALEKDRTRRYETASAFADDIQRYLRSEPVDAGPPTVRYRIRKFVKRNKGAVVGAASIFIILAAGVVTSTVLAIGQSIARQAEHTQRVEAQLQADMAQAILEFLNDDLLAAVAPSDAAGKGREVRMRDVLDVASDRIDEASEPGGRFFDKPIVEARIRATLGWTYRVLGELETAERHLVRALELKISTLGRENSDTLISMRNLAILYAIQSKFEDAEPLFVESLQIHERVYGEDHPETLAMMNDVGILHWSLSRYDDAEKILVRAIDILKRSTGADDPELLRPMGNLSLVYHDQGRWVEAEALSVETLEIQKRVLGPGHPDTIAHMHNLATLYDDQERYDEAEELYVEALNAQERVLGPEHQDTLRTAANLGSFLTKVGRYDEAEEILARTLEAQRRVLSDDHPDTLATVNNLGNLRSKQGRGDEAMALYSQSLDGQTRTLGEEHTDTLISMVNLAIKYQEHDRPDESERLHTRALGLRLKVLGEEHPSTILSMLHVANACMEREAFDDAERLVLDALAIAERARGSADRYTLFGIMKLAEHYSTNDRFDDAVRLQTMVLDASRRTWPDGDLMIGVFQTDLGSTLIELNRFDDAQTSLLDAYEILVSETDTAGERRRKTVNALIHLYTSWHEAEPEADLDMKAVEWRAILGELEDSAMDADQSHDQQNGDF